MKSIEGLYTAINATITQMEMEDHAVLKAETLIDAVKEQVDVYSATLDWYIRFALRAAVEVGLYQNGYKSVIKGKGLFVNPTLCKKPEYLARLFNNAKLTELQKKQAVDAIMGSIKASGCEGQLSMDFSTGLLSEDITEPQLLEMLEREADSVREEEHIRQIEDSETSKTSSAEENKNA